MAIDCNLVHIEKYQIQLGLEQLGLHLNMYKH